MSNVRFASFLTTGGNDRGSIQPLYIYEAELPIATYKYQHQWLGRVGAGIQGALEQAYNLGLQKGREDVGVFLDVFTTLEEYIDDEDIDRQIHDNRFISDGARSVKAKAEDAAQQIVSDALASGVLEDMYEMENPINWVKVWADLDAPAPEPTKIPVGTRVYILLRDTPHEAIFDGLVGDYLHNGRVAGKEKQLVPVEFVQSRNYQVEAFPLPQKVLYTGRDVSWWARATDNKKVEGVGRSKKEAVRSVTVQLALRDFWA